MSTEKARCAWQRAFPRKGLERREVEKCSAEGKIAAHGTRDLSVFKVQKDFERQITKLKTKIDKIVNISDQTAFLQKLP